MSNEILCCINSTQDISDLDLREKEECFARTGVTIKFVSGLTHGINIVLVSVFPHRQVAGHPLQQLDTLAQGTLCEKDNKLLPNQTMFKSLGTHLEKVHHVTSLVSQHEPRCYCMQTQKPLSQCRPSTASYPRSDIFLSPFYERKGRRGKKQD